MPSFTSQDARTHGYSADQFRRLDHPTHGVATDEPHDSTVRARCEAVLPAFAPDDVFTHLTAAALFEWWTPSVEPYPIIVGSDGEAAHRDRRGFYVRRCSVPPGHRTTLGELPVTSPAWTIAELAEDLALIDLVVVIDAALHHGHVTLAELRAVVIRGRRGVRTLRRAIKLADARSDSPWETVLRLLHVLCGIPVDPQDCLRDPDTGAVIWRLDLRIRGTRRAAEFDGRIHTCPDVRQRDLRRDKVLARNGTERFAYTATDIRENAAGIIGDAEDALGWPHDPRRLKIWTAEFERSTMSRPGYGRLMRRLRRFDRRETPRRSAAPR